MGNDMNDYVTEIIEPPKHDTKRVRNLAVLFFILKLAVCVGIVEFIFRNSTVSQGIRFLIAWVASFLIGVVIDLVIRMKKSWSYLTKTE